MKTPITQVSHTRLGRSKVKILQPLRYYPITFQLEDILHRLDDQLLQISTKKDSAILYDIWDGQQAQNILQHMTTTQKQTNEQVLGLTLNVDWFQPFKHVTHSTGAIYLCLNNLPRHYLQQFLDQKNHTTCRVFSLLLLTN